MEFYHLDSVRNIDASEIIGPEVGYIKHAMNFAINLLYENRIEGVKVTSIGNQRKPKLLELNLNWNNGIAEATNGLCLEASTYALTNLFQNSKEHFSEFYLIHSEPEGPTPADDKFFNFNGTYHVYAIAKGNNNIWYAFSPAAQEIGKKGEEIQITKYLIQIKIANSSRELLNEIRSDVGGYWPEDLSKYTGLDRILYILSDYKGNHPDFSFGESTYKLHINYALQRIKEKKVNREIIENLVNKLKLT